MFVSNVLDISAAYTETVDNINSPFNRIHLNWQNVLTSSISSMAPLLCSLWFTTFTRIIFFKRIYEYLISACIHTTDL